MFFFYFKFFNSKISISANNKLVVKFPVSSNEKFGTAESKVNILYELQQLVTVIISLLGALTEILLFCILEDLSNSV